MTIEIRDHSEAMVWLAGSWVRWVCLAAIRVQSLFIWTIIIIIIIIRHAPCQCVAPLATNSLHSDLSKASSTASSKVRLIVPFGQREPLIALCSLLKDTALANCQKSTQCVHNSYAKNLVIEPEF